MTNETSRTETMALAALRRAYETETVYIVRRTDDLEIFAVLDDEKTAKNYVREYNKEPTSPGGFGYIAWDIQR